MSYIKEMKSNIIETPSIDQLEKTSCDCTVGTTIEEIVFKSIPYLKAYPHAFLQQTLRERINEKKTCSSILYSKTTNKAKVPATRRASRQIPKSEARRAFCPPPYYSSHSDPKVHIHSIPPHPYPASEINKDSFLMVQSSKGSPFKVHKNALKIHNIRNSLLLSEP
jgi:hypothetical protein